MSGYTRDDLHRYHATLRFPRLTRSLAADLQSIEPSHPANDLRYYPCLATMKNGSGRDFVYVVEARSWLRHWGPLPGFPVGHGMTLVDVAAIHALRSSPNRLPARIANDLYAAGESGMGYAIFTIRFRNGSTAAFDTGNALDFVRYPPGQAIGDVVGAAVHVGRNDPKRQPGPAFAWALFEEETEADKP